MLYVQSAYIKQVTTKPYGETVTSLFYLLPGDLKEAAND